MSYTLAYRPEPNRPVTHFCMRDVFPTPISPRMMTWWTDYLAILVENRITGHLEQLFRHESKVVPAHHDGEITIASIVARASWGSSASICSGMDRRCVRESYIYR